MRPCREIPWRLPLARRFRLSIADSYSASAPCNVSFNPQDTEQLPRLRPLREIADGEQHPTLRVVDVELVIHPVQRFLHRPAAFPLVVEHRMRFPVATRVFVRRRPHL